MGCGLSVENDQGFNRTVAFIGLDNSGKSRIVYNLVNTDQSQEYVPICTAGAAFYEIQMGGSSFRIYDVGGLGRYREQWPYYISQSDAVCFVIDKSDKDRLGRVREEITEVLKLCAQKSLPLLILSNKTDLDKEITISDIQSITQVGASRIEYTIKECCAVTGDGINAGREWLMSHIKPKSNAL